MHRGCRDASHFYTSNSNQTHSQSTNARTQKITNTRSDLFDYRGNTTRRIACRARTRISRRSSVNPAVRQTKHRHRSRRRPTSNSHHACCATSTAHREYFAHIDRVCARARTQATFLAYQIAIPRKRMRTPLPPPVASVKSR